MMYSEQSQELARRLRDKALRNLGKVSGPEWDAQCIEEIAIALYNFTPELQMWNGDPYSWYEDRGVSEKRRNKFRERARVIREIVRKQA